MENKKKKEEDGEIIEVAEEIIEEEGFQDKLKKLREELKLCHQEKSEYLAGWQRAKADFINARKDEEKSREEFLKLIEEKVLLDFLSVADSLEMALKHEPSEGVRKIYGQLQEILKGRGALPLESAGEKFNPKEHEALERVEVDEKDKDEVVLEELQRGYRIGERILRPAKVKVGVLRK